MMASTVSGSASSDIIAPGIANRAKMAAQQFEAFFLSQMFENMWSGAEPDPVFGGGQAETVFRSMLNEQYAASMTRRGGIGIADAVLREMVRMMEAGNSR